MLDASECLGSSILISVENSVRVQLVCNQRKGKKVGVML